MKLYQSGPGLGFLDSRYVRLNPSASQTITGYGLTIEKDLTVNQNLNLLYTTGSTAGVITLEGDRFIHGYPYYDNLFIGNGAGNFTNTGENNTAVGAFIMDNVTSGSYNTAMGYNALGAITIGTENAAFGMSCGQSITSGSYNVALGRGALLALQTGDNNMGIGRLSLSSVVSGSNNAGVGQFTLRFTTGSGNTAIGDSSGTANTTGTNNLYLGYLADTGNTGLTNATAIGYNSRVNQSNAIVLGATGADSVDVGIGTDTPAAKLHISGHADNQHLQIDVFGSQATNNVIAVGPSGSTWYAMAPRGDITISPAIRTTGSPTLFTITGPAHTTLTASTEATDVNWNLARTVQFATALPTTQRAIRIQAPTYAVSSGSTMTTGVTFDISGAPIAGTNATITNKYALRVNTGTDTGVAGVFKANSGTQSGNLVEMQDSSATILSKFDYRGFLGIGIGTAATQAPLDIQIDAGGTGFRINNSGTEYTRFVSGGVVKGMLGTGSVPFVIRNAGLIQFGAGGGSDTVFIDASGNMGVRISASIAAPLHVKGYADGVRTFIIENFSATTTANTFEMRTIVAGTPTNVTYIEPDGEFVLGLDNNAIKFGTGVDATILYDGTNLVINPRLVGSGVVYITSVAGAAGLRVGATSCGYVQAVAGDASIAGAFEWRLAAGTRLAYFGYSATDIQLNLENSAKFIVAAGTATMNRAFVANEEGGDYDFRVESDTDVNNIFSDASTNRVGIGMNNPGYKFDVTGDINTSGVYRTGGTAGVSGSFTTVDLKTVTVTNGIITAIV